MRVIEGAAEGGRPVDLGEGDDFLPLMAQVEPALGALRMIRRRAGRETEEGKEQPLVAGLAPLVQEGLHMVGLLRVLAFFVAAQMLGDQLVAGKQPPPVGVKFEREQLAGPGRRHRVAVGLAHDPAAVWRPHRPEECRLVGRGRQGPQLRFSPRNRSTGRRCVSRAAARWPPCPARPAPPD